MKSAFIRNVASGAQARIIDELHKYSGFVSVVDFPEKGKPSEKMLFVKVENSFEDFRDFAMKQFPEIQLQEGVTL